MGFDLSPKPYTEEERKDLTEELEQLVQAIDDPGLLEIVIPLSQHPVLQNAFKMDASLREDIKKQALEQGWQNVRFSIKEVVFVKKRPELPEELTAEEEQAPQPFEIQLLYLAAAFVAGALGGVIVLLVWITAFK